MKTIKGVIPIVAAPFTESGELDERSFGNVVDRLLDAGVNGLTLFGLATEFYKLTDREKETMRCLFLERTARHPQAVGMVSVTAHSVETAVREAREAQRLGADAIMLLPPFFLQPGIEHILRHIQAVAAASSVPIVIQYAPAQTGVRIEAERFVELHRVFPCITHIKVETVPPGRYISRLLELSGGGLGALVGYAGIQMPDALARGAAGIQPGCSFSELYVELYRRYLAGGEEGQFAALFQEVLPYLSYWMQSVELIIKIEKIILKRRGLISSDLCRSPSYEPDGRELKQIEKFLTRFEPYWQE